MAVRFPDPIHPVDPVELEINKLFDHLIMCINQRRMALLNTYRDTRDQRAARLAHRTPKEQELIALKTETERLLQMNELREIQLRILAEIEQKLAEVRVTQPETHVVFRGNCGLLEQLIAGVGQLVEEELHVVPRYEEMRRTLAVGKKGKAPGELYEPQGVAIDENTNRIYVAEGLGSRRISIFSEVGEFINTFKLLLMERPYGLAIHRDNLYMTDIGAHAVFKFKVEPGLRFFAMQQRRFLIAQLNRPLGLTVSTNGDVFIADYGNNRIQILDDSLRFQRLITHQTMKSPRDVKLTPDEVYVLCHDSPCILVFSHAGEKIRSIITQGYGMQIWKAHFFCLDRKQNLLISDWGNSQVRIFSKDGTHLHTIGEPELGHEVGMFYFPKGLALTKNLKLIIVSWNNNYRLQIYSC